MVVLHYKTCLQKIIVCFFHFFMFAFSHFCIFSLKKHPLFLEYLLYWYHCYFVFAEIISCIGKGYYLSILILAFWLLIKIGQSRHFITFLPCFSLSSIYNWFKLQSRFDNHLSINHSQSLTSNIWTKNLLSNFNFYCWE